MADGQRQAGAGTAIEPGLLQRVSGAISWLATGKTPDWFGPSQPLQTVAPQASVEGRSRDYPVAVNMSYTPKSNDGAVATFPALRQMADAYDILRLVIETRKDQIGRFKWNVRRKDGKADQISESIQAHLAFPDGRQPFHTWLRMLLEDVMVVDAPTVYVNRSAGVPVFEVIDGTTIKPLIDQTGRTPRAPFEAYQAVLKGVPAARYTEDELVYRPRNPRPHKGYGYSPVEQILTTVNIGLRRVTQQLVFFTTGSLPEALVGTPENWNPDQIRAFQDIFDAMMSGNLGKRAGVTFIPGGTDIHQFKTDAVVKNEFDEWLARIVCFAFSIPPSAFVKEVNRATAETAAEQSKEEGLAPLLLWAKAFVDELIQKHLGAHGYEFVWDMAAMEPQDKKVTRVVALKQAGIISVEVAQDMLGIERHEVAQAAPSLPAPGGAVQKLAKADSTVEPDMSNDETALAGIISPYLDVAKEKAVKAGQAALESGTPLPEPMTERERKSFAKAVAPSIKSAALRGVSVGAATLAGQAEGLPNPLDVETPAAQWAKTRSAWLVGMKWVDGKLVPNPNSTYQISDVMRDALRGQVAKAVEEGWTSIKLAEAIRAHDAFSVARANNIARTEIAEAQEEGSMVYYRASGVVDRKKWSTAHGGDMCPRCIGAEAEGAIPLEATFESTGTVHAPGHQHCRCRVLPVLKEATP